jgi:hypothetical protein
MENYLTISTCGRLLNKSSESMRYTLKKYKVAIHVINGKMYVKKADYEEFKEKYFKDREVKSVGTIEELARRIEIAKKAVSERKSLFDIKELD